MNPPSQNHDSFFQWIPPLGILSHLCQRINHRNETHRFIEVPWERFLVSVFAKFPRGYYNKPSLWPLVKLYVGICCIVLLRIEAPLTAVVWFSPPNGSFEAWKIHITVVLEQRYTYLLTPMMQSQASGRSMVQAQPFETLRNQICPKIWRLTLYNSMAPGLEAINPTNHPEGSGSLGKYWVSKMFTNGIYLTLETNSEFSLENKQLPQNKSSFFATANFPGKRAVSFREYMFKYIYI